MQERLPGHEPGTAEHDLDAVARPQLEHPFLDLQRSAGNAVVRRLVQTKLTVGRADDPYEREADRVAAEVVRRLQEPGGGAATVQRKGAGTDALGGTAVTPEMEQQIAASPGEPLPGDLRTKLESTFGGADLSAVRVHTGPDAATLAEALQARAFTTGSDIFFGRGQFNPDSKAGQELLAHEATHVVQQRQGVQLQRFVDPKLFAERTYEGRFTQKSTAQKAIEKLLVTYNALGAKNDKGKVVIPDTKLAQGIELLQSMKDAAELWINAHTIEVEDETGTTPPAPGQAPKKKTLVDPKRTNRAAGFSWFLMAVDSELSSMIARRDSDALAGTTQDEVVVDSTGKAKLKEHYTGNLSGALTKAAWILGKVAPEDGDSTEFSLDLKIPVYEGVFIGGTLDLAAERDGITEVSAEAAFQAGGTAGIADIAGALGGYLKAGAKTPEQVMKLISYGFYRRCVESSVIPREMSNLIWGGGTSDYAKAKADQWSRGVETEVFADGVEGADEAYVEMGGLAKVAAEVGIGQAGKFEAEAKAQLGTRYDQTSLKNRKGGAGEKNQKSSSFFTQNVADKFGRGAEKSAGRTSTNFEVSAGLSFLDGSLQGTATLEAAIRSQGLHADQRKGLQGAKNNVKLEDLSFSIEVAGMLPMGGFVAQVASLGLDIASYGRKKYLASLKQAESKPEIPVSELLLAKAAGETVFQGVTGVPFADWAKKAVGFGAENAGDAAAKAGEKALDMGSKVGVELGFTIEKGDGGVEASVELKHVKSMSVELPSILEIELLRKSRLGVAKYAGGAWSVSL